MKINSKITNDFIKHNKSLFYNKREKIKKKNIFLLEFNGWQGVQIANSYLINSETYIKKCKIIGYENFRIFDNKKSLNIDNIKWKLGPLLNIRNFGTYSSFGVDKFIYKKNKSNDLSVAKKITHNFFKKVKTKKDIENFTIKKIWIGDLIYDSYLKKYSIPTINLKSENFKIFFQECVLIFLFWEDYFKQNNVKGISSSHAVYTNGIPLRIAVKKRIDAFICVDTRLYKIDYKSCSFKNKTNGFDYQFKLFRKTFNNFSKEKKKIYLKKGQSFLNEVVKGKKNYFYMPSFNKGKKIKKIFKKNRLKKIVIFAHSFFDSPHVYGNFLFPDFYEWLRFLSKISLKTNYDWYLKPHPNAFKEEKIINQFLKENPNIKKINSNVKNINLVKEGLDYGLTVYGSCAAELSYFGIKVVNADINNPHYRYNFSFNPKNVKEYEEIILNLKDKKLKFSKKELYEFHYMNQFYFHNHYIFKDYAKYHKSINGRQLMYTNKIIKDWMKNFSVKEHNQILNNIKNFINDKEHFLSLKHTTKKNPIY